MTHRLHSFYKTWQTQTQCLAQQILGAIAFYTILPIPTSWNLQFSRITRWAPMIGSGLGFVLWGIDWALGQTTLPALLNSTLVVLLWIYMTGGLHLDGAMDTADGLGVFAPTQRLAVMTDSRSGAFGVMAAIAIILLKITALAALSQDRGFALLMVPGWGRWGHVLAVAQYPYLKQEGKGALHQQTFIPGWDILPGGINGLIGVAITLHGSTHSFLWYGAVLSLGYTLPWAIGRWFNHQFEGMTGDIYGAIVEWTEALLLLGLAGLEYRVIPI